VGRELWIADVDYTPWADRRSLDNAEQVAAQGVVETFGITLQNWSPTEQAYLPTLPQGHVPVMLVDVWGVGAEDYDTLGSGLLQTVALGDGSFGGSASIKVATPIKPLKTKLHSVVFHPEAAYEPTDVARIRKLGTMIAPALTGWAFDFTTYVLDPGNVTYPDPIYPNPHDGTSGDAYTEYVEASIEDIIRNIATDPGWFTDPGYPAQARNWWIEGRWVDSTNKTLGVVWYLHYQNIPTPASIVDLLDAPDDTVAEPKALYYAGADINIDYSTVVRRINIAGQKREPRHINWVEHIWPWKTNHGIGFIFKKLGEDGVWDSGAVSQQIVDGGEWHVQCQTQELYLEHDTFQRDDQPELSTTNQGNLWINYDHDAKIRIEGQLAVPKHGSGKINLSHIEAYASTCIIRAHLARNREGAAVVFRYKDYYNYWYVMRQGAGYGLHKVENGADGLVQTYGGNTADMAEIKISLINSDLLNQIQVFIDDVFQDQYDDPFLVHETHHGLMFDCRIAGADGGAFYDFQVTHLYGDKSFGLGDANGTVAKPMTSWIHHSFGYVFNSDGTVAIVNNGDPIDVAEWYEAGQNSYAPNDRWDIMTAEFVLSTGEKIRFVQWLKQPGGQGPWLILYEIRPVTTTPLPTPAAPWHAQFAAKERGAALANLMIGVAYSNLFVADDALYVPLFGNNAWYPANGTLQSDQLDNYQKRQRVADAVFRAEADPKVTATLPSHYEVKRGEFARITSRRAGWVKGPPDTRRILMCTGSKRIEGGAAGALSKPLYRMRFGSHVYSSADPGRTYLLRPGDEPKKPLNKDRPFFDGMALRWGSHVLSGLEDYGQKFEVKVVPQDALDWENRVWPTYIFDSEDGTPELPASLFPANGKYMIYYRTVSSSGVASDWSDGVPFVSPPQAASDRTSTLGLYIGDGTTAITTTGPGAYSQEAMVNQGYKLVAWALSLANVVGDVTVDIEHCTAAERREDGEAAWVSICGVGQKPFVSNGGGGNPVTNDGTYNDSENITQYDARAFNLRTGDYLRAKVVSATTAATTATLMLAFMPLPVPFTQQAGMENGQLMGQPGLVDVDGEPLVDTDNEPLVGA
jgi:hypothetical protein